MRATSVSRPHGRDRRVHRQRRASRSRLAVLPGLLDGGTEGRGGRRTEPRLPALRFHGRLRRLRAGQSDTRAARRRGRAHSRLQHGLPELALVDIGMFDPTHRAAGDDVDVCWRLLVRGRESRSVPRPSSITTARHRARLPEAAEGLRIRRGAPAAPLSRAVQLFRPSGVARPIYDSANHGLRHAGLPLLFVPRSTRATSAANSFSRSISRS